MKNIKCLFLVLLLISVGSSTVIAQDASKELRSREGLSSMERFAKDRIEVEEQEQLLSTDCVGGMAGAYPCKDIDLLAFMPLSTIGGGAGSDIWGWTDPNTGVEYAIMGRSNGTAFVSLADPENPVYIGNLPTNAGTNSWRDVKVYANHAFIVADNTGNHGMQVFDLMQLAGVTSPPQTFTNTAVYTGIGKSHNIVINEDSGFAYSVGGNDGNSCSSGLHMIDISTPASPTFAGCFASDGYTHDAQCVMYDGPDTDYQGSEICFNSNEDTVTIVDVSNKSAPVQISRTGYPTSDYTHQGWLSEDQKYFYLNDELDEGSVNTRTYVWDVEDLDDPVIVNTHTHTTAATDHNLYIKGELMYQANYRAGLRILDTSDPLNLEELAFFDIYPANDSSPTNGAWSNYPYFDSGVVIVSGIEQGLFVLRPMIERLRFSKEAASISIPNGMELEYTLTAFNDTPDPITNVVISDDLPTNTSYVAGSASDGGSESGGTVSFPSVTLTAGQTITRTFKVLVSVPGLGGGSVFFEDDMESGAAPWTASHGSGTSDFSRGTANPHGGSFAWHAVDVGSVADQYLTSSSPFVVSGNAELRFWHSYDTEATYDGGVVEISAGGGAWTDLGPMMTSGGYNDSMSSSSGSPIGGRSAFGGNSSGYVQTVVDLSSFDGQSISIRFRFGSDQSVSDVGWFIDDVMVLSGPETISNEACIISSEFPEQCSSVSTIVTAPEGVTVPIKVWLSGAYDADQDQMTPSMNALIPSLQPYSDPALDGTFKDYNGTETSAIPTTMVDWVLVELRTGTSSSTTIGKQVGLLLEDGSVVGPNSIPLKFTVAPDGSYFIVVRHRNHLGIMSASAVPLTGTSALYDMTTEAQVFGTNAMRELESGVFGMWSGDGNADESTTANDFTNIWLTSSGLNGYLMADFNLDGSTTTFDYLLDFLPANGQSSQIPN